MERENKKRGREQSKKNPADQKSGKKQHLINNNRNINTKFDDESDSYDSLDDYLELGVFDFPWLHEGMISKSDEWNFEDAFSSSLINGTYNSTTAVMELAGETPPTPPVHFQCDKFEEKHVVWPLKDDDDDELELEGFDCIWRSLLNQPLFQQDV